MEALQYMGEALLEGLRFLREYVFYPTDGETFSLIRLFSLFIAFSISGALVVFVSQGAILKHMGPDAKPVKAYAVAAVSGAVLAVCSCSVLPMFASIRKKGAGLGPAVAFLFSGPAINVLALSFTFSALGVDIALSRVIGAVVLAVLIGFLVHLIFQRQEAKSSNGNGFAALPTSDAALAPWQKGLFFLTMFAIMIFSVYLLIPTLILIVLLIGQLVLYFTWEDIKAWAYESFVLIKKIIPLFMLGVFFAGVVRFLVTEDLIAGLVGSNSFFANAIAAASGALVYFATLTEIPWVEALLDLGMHRGPAVALLLAGPSLSIPNMIIITKVIGIKRSGTYIVLVVILSALVGLLAGMIFGLL